MPPNHDLGSDTVLLTVDNGNRMDAATVRAVVHSMLQTCTEILSHEPMPCTSRTSACHDRAIQFRTLSGIEVVCSENTYFIDPSGNVVRASHLCPGMFLRDFYNDDVAHVICDAKRLAECTVLSQVLVREDTHVYALGLADKQMKHAIMVAY